MNDTYTSCDGNLKIDVTFHVVALNWLQLPTTVERVKELALYTACFDGQYFLIGAYRRDVRFGKERRQANSQGCLKMPTTIRTLQNLGVRTQGKKMGVLININDNAKEVLWVGAQDLLLNVSPCDGGEERLEHFCLT